jgi:hypothetical protein
MGIPVKERGTTLMIALLHTQPHAKAWISGILPENISMHNF